MIDKYKKRLIDKNKVILYIRTAYVICFKFACLGNTYDNSVLMFSLENEKRDVVEFNNSYISPFQ